MHTDTNTPPMHIFIAYFHCLWLRGRAFPSLAVDGGHPYLSAPALGSKNLIGCFMLLHLSICGSNVRPGIQETNDILSGECLLLNGLSTFTSKIPGSISFQLFSRFVYVSAYFSGFPSKLFLGQISFYYLSAAGTQE